MAKRIRFTVVETNIYMRFAEQKGNENKTRRR